MINPDKIHEKPETRRFRLLLEKQGREEGRKTGLEEGRKTGLEEGEARGRAASLLLVLEQRGLPMTDTQRTLIQECTDVAQLDAWLLDALTAATANDLLGTRRPRKPTPRAARRPAVAPTRDVRQSLPREKR